jgi:hypothetical protein
MAVNVEYVPDVCPWPVREVPAGPGNVCCLEQTGRNADIAKLARLTLAV